MLVLDSNTRARVAAAATATTWPEQGWLEVAGVVECACGRGDVVVVGSGTEETTQWYMQL